MPERRVKHEMSKAAYQRARRAAIKAGTWKPQRKSRGGNKDIVYEGRAQTAAEIEALIQRGLKRHKEDRGIEAVDYFASRSQFKNPEAVKAISNLPSGAEFTITSRHGKDSRYRVQRYAIGKSSVLAMSNNGEFLGGKGIAINTNSQINKLLQESRHKRVTIHNGGNTINRD